MKKTAIVSYCIVQRKIILSKYLPSDLVNIIMKFLKDNIILIYNKGGISRSLYLTQTNFEMYNQMETEINNLLGFKLSSKDRNSLYTIDEIISISTFFKDMKLLKEITSSPETNIINYKEFYLCDHKKNDKFKIKGLTQYDNQSSYVKYDSICGLDLLLMIMIIMYNIICRKASKTKRDKLKSKGSKEIYV